MTERSTTRSTSGPWAHVLRAFGDNADMTTRDEAQAIIAAEGLHDCVWFADPTNRTEIVGIGADADGWYTYATNERATVSGVARFEQESDALDSLVHRLRAGKSARQYRAKRAAEHGQKHSAPPTQHVAEPQPAALEQAAVIREIAQSVGSNATGDWRTARFVAHMTAAVSSCAVFISDGGDERRTLAARDAKLAAERLRTLMYKPGAGTWFTMEVLVRRERTADARFDYDSEPAFHVPPSDLAYVEDARVFPRDAAHTPDWLAAKLHA